MATRPTMGRPTRCEAWAWARCQRLVEVLEAFPERRFLIDHKDGSMQTAELLVDILQGLPPERQSRLYYWGAGGDLRLCP